MEETIFEVMERTRFVDRLLPALALFIPVLIFTALKMFRHSDTISRRRPELILTAVSMPIIWILWRIYNAVADHYGVASIAGILVNAVIFLMMSAAIWSFYFLVLLRHDAQTEIPADDGSAHPPAATAENLPRDDA